MKIIKRNRGKVFTAGLMLSGLVGGIGAVTALRVNFLAGVFIFLSGLLLLCLFVGWYR